MSRRRLMTTGGRLGVAALAMLAGAALLWWLGGYLIAPTPARVGAPPAFLPAETVHIPSASGSRLAGWFAPGRPGRGGVLLLHGRGGYRDAMLGRARFLRRQGRAVLLLDLQGHGESPGRHMTYGYLEARDAEAAVAWLRRRLPGEALGIIGFSLGGAAALLGAAAATVDALVIEAVYTDIRDAVDNRLAMRLGPVGPWLSPLLLLQFPPRLGFDPEVLAPLRRIADLRTPVYVVGGALDQRTTAEDTRRLFAAAVEPKRLWLVEGAAHEDFHAFDPSVYERRVGGFLDRYLVPR